MVTASGWLALPACQTDELPKAVLSQLSIQLDHPAVACGLTDLVN